MGRIHPLMSFAIFAQVGSRTFSGLRDFFVIGFFLMSMVESPELPGMSMGGFDMGTLVVLIGMGMEEQEGGLNEYGIKKEQGGCRGSAPLDPLPPLKR